MMTVLTAVGAIAMLTFVLATLLLVASRRLHVDEDPRLERVDEMLPHNNCGACGFPSCRLFAEALVATEVLPGKCTVGSPEERTEIAAFLNVDAGAEVKRVARLACAGGTNVATRHAHYQGVETCNAAAQVAGGGKGCFWGCLGLGDCERICDFDAILMDPYSLPVVDEDKCTACGDCIDVCPKDLFALQSVNQHLWVPCRNLEEGDAILDYCEVGCTACGRCALDEPGGLIRMHDGLPLIDYTRGQDYDGDFCSRVAIERCPTGAIVWIDDRGRINKGVASKKIVRHSALPEVPS